MVKSQIYRTVDSKGRNLGPVWNQQDGKGSSEFGVGPNPRYSTVQYLRFGPTVP
jgi:hypothetical protein